MSLAARQIAPRKRNAPRPAEKSAPLFLQWLRGRPCAVEGCDRPGKMTAAHVDHAGDKGIGTKVSDRHTIPLCGGFMPEGHAPEQHRIGWRTFEAKYIPGGDAVKLAAEYWRAWPGRGKWEAKNGR